jgi:HPr kinase/phosphorylase
VGVARSLTASTLYDELQERLGLQWIVGSGKGQDRSVSDHDLTARPSLAGFLNLIHPNKVQVLGHEELQYLNRMPATQRAGTVDDILMHDLLAIVLGDGLAAPPDLIDRAGKRDVPILASELPSWELVNLLQYYISKSLARRTSLHGVFMEVFTIGVLLTGDSGCGKSELALELLNRGHRLIADDAPEFTQVSPEIIDGTCPEALQDCLEVRGLGVLNVRRMFGDAAIKLNKFLRLIINLEVPQAGRVEMTDRLHGNTSEVPVLDLEIPSITLPVLAGRNLAVIVEAAVRPSDICVNMSSSLEACCCASLASRALPWRNSATSRALRSFLTTRKSSPALGVFDKPSTTAGSDGPADLIELPDSSNMLRIRPYSSPAIIISPCFKVPACTTKVATAPRPFSRLDSMTIPWAGPSWTALRSITSACSRIASSRLSIPSPFSAETFTNWCSPPQSSGMTSCCDSSFFTRSGSAFSRSILFTATTIGTSAAFEC